MPHRKRGLTRVYTVCVLGGGGRGEGLAVCGARPALHGAAAQTCRLAVTDAQLNLHVTRFNNAETNGRVYRCSGV
jgi:hypothetical protein